MSATNGVDRPVKGLENNSPHPSSSLSPQLPTPSLSPEAEDVSWPAHVSSAHGLSTRRPSASNEEAVLSDTSEQWRPPPAIKRSDGSRRKSSLSENEKTLRLSPRQIHELTTEPRSLPIRAATPILEDALEEEGEGEAGPAGKENRGLGVVGVVGVLEPPIELNGFGTGLVPVNGERRATGKAPTPPAPPPIVDARSGRPSLSSRAISTPLLRRKPSSQRSQGHGYDGDVDKPSSKHVPPPLNLDHKEPVGAPGLKSSAKEREPSPMPTSMPLPPFSLPTFLSLELSSRRPSPLYIYRPPNADFPYESSKVKYERLVNFLLLPPKLEGILGFGALACLDAWMHILTILPLRFLIALCILVKWWLSVIIKEMRDLWTFVYSGLGRLWRRRRRGPESQAPTPVMTPAEEVPPPPSGRPPTSAPSSANPLAATRESGNAVTREMGTVVPRISLPDPKERRLRSSRYRHRRTRSTPSALLPSHKADILKGLLVIASCAILMRFDASRMYHSIRGQAAIKLYVIYNVLEVCDRLLSAVGQDVLECLFSRETLDRNPDGRSKVLRPFWMFLLALVYNVAHAAALFYQVITLNVAVNSYSNALLTLLLSNQFVEIKGTVFKKFEKENLFQITCADIVERFQLWLMLLIIAMRNIVEMGGLSTASSASPASWRSAFGGGTASNSTVPFTASSILPLSFTIFPKWLGQVLNPFLLVLGSEMLVDWLKHAYITKFNQTKPEVYGKFLDVLAKDYYSNAFTDPNLTRRLGLPVLPLACLFIRAAVQTYHMFIATHMPPPIASAATSLTTESMPVTSPATTAALAHIDQLFRRALGRSTFGIGSIPSVSSWSAYLTWTLDDLIALLTMSLVFLIGYLFFLAFKLVLGMLLLRIARNRYHGMKERERLNVETGGKRIGGWGVVDVTEEQRRWIYNDDPEGLRSLRERDEKTRKKEEKDRVEGTSFGHVERYAMVAKRIW
jgi:hypothetical protein